MQNYFLTDLSSQEITTLQTRKIEYCDMEIDGQAGLVIDSENIQPALQTLGKKIEAETTTSIEGIIKTSLIDVLYSVKTGGEWSGYHKDRFKKAVEEILLPCIQMDVEISILDGNSMPGEKVNDNFQIFIWKPLYNTASKKTPNEMFGVEVDWPYGCLPSGLGVNIIDPHTQWVVGELRENGLFIHHDVCHCGFMNEVRLFRKILEETVIELTATPEDKAEKKRKIEKEKQNQARNQYIQECQKRFEKTLKGTKDKITEGHKKIEELQKALVRTIRETQGAERKLEQLETTRPTQLKGYAQEFDSLTGVPGVESVETNDGVIKVFTEHIYITPDNSSDMFDIGKFRMEIYTSGANGGIRFFNLTRQGSGSDWNTNHPHVSKQGTPCLGNIKEMVAQLIGEYEYSAIARLGLQYLQSVNLEDSAGKGIFTHWPKVDKKEVIENAGNKMAV
jgi:hypothetical protein